MIWRYPTGERGWDGEGEEELPSESESGRGWGEGGERRMAAGETGNG